MAKKKPPTEVIPEPKSDKEIFEEGLREYSDEQLLRKFLAIDQEISPFRAEIERRNEAAKLAELQRTQEKQRRDLLARDAENLLVISLLDSLLKLAPDHEGRTVSGTRCTEDSRGVNLFNNLEPRCTRCALLELREDLRLSGSRGPESVYVPRDWKFRLSVTRDLLPDPDQFLR